MGLLGKRRNPLDLSLAVLFFLLLGDGFFCTSNEKALGGMWEGVPSPTTNTMTRSDWGNEIDGASNEGSGKREKKRLRTLRKPKDMEAGHSLFR